MAELILQDCHVPEQNRQRKRPACFNSSMEWERSCILASRVGAMQRQLETCIKYAQNAASSASPLASFSFRIELRICRFDLKRLG